MSKFAKLFDVDTHQVLVRRTSDDEGNPSLIISTRIGDAEPIQGVIFRPEDGTEENYNKAVQASIDRLEAFDQQDAVEFIASMREVLQETLPTEVTGLDDGVPAEYAGEPEEDAPRVLH